MTGPLTSDAADAAQTQPLLGDAAHQWKPEITNRAEGAYRLTLLLQGLAEICIRKDSIYMCAFKGDNSTITPAAKSLGRVSGRVQHSMQQEAP